MKVNTDKILREYYLNLFSSSAEITKRGNNNFMYKWNIRDLQLSKNAEIGLLQITNNRATLTDERQYPPKAFNSFTDEITTTEILNKTSYKQIITLNTDNITYGSGEYIIYSSSTGAPSSTDRYKHKMFNFNLGDISGFAFNQYVNNVGTYLQNNFIIDDYLGDWIIIKLPISIILSRLRLYRFTIIGRAPALWRCYGSKDGITFTEIKEGSQNTILTETDYNLGYYEKNLPYNSIEYTYIGFTFNRIIGTDSLGALNISEIQLFGREEIKLLSEERQYPPKAFDSFTNATSVSYLEQSIFRETITLNPDNINYGIGTYEIYSTSRNGPVALQRLSFNYNLFDTNLLFAYSKYNATTGYYTLTTNYIINNYFGEFVIIKLINPIILTKFRFWAQTNNIQRAPSLWRCYGSNDGINYEEIPNAHNDNDSNALIAASYPNLMYEKIVNDNTKSYLYIGFVINKIVSPTATSLSFAELELFGKEELDYTYVIRTLNSYNDGFDSQNSNPVLYLGDDLRKIKNPSYHKLISQNQNQISLTFTDEMDKPNKGIRDDIDFGMVLHIKDNGEQKE